MSEHPNAIRAREGFDRFIRGDGPALLDLFADDAVWHVPGSMALSGAHRGRDAIARGARPDGRSLDIEQALLIEIENGLWQNVRAQPLDQARFDAFWT